jgi:hypothetical protein
MKVQRGKLRESREVSRGESKGRVNRRVKARA